MTIFLLKTEPGDYSFADLVRDGVEPWDGVRNPTAQIHMRTVRKGDAALIYHTGKERAIVGLAKVVSDVYEDPSAPGFNARDEIRHPLFDVQAVCPVKTKVTLEQIKADARLEGIDLVRLPRLSVMRLDKAVAKILVQEAGLAAHKFLANQT